MLNALVKENREIHNSGAIIRRYYFSDFIKNRFVFNRKYDSLVFFTFIHQFQFFCRRKNIFNYSLDSTYLSSIECTKSKIMEKMKNGSILPAHIPHAKELVNYLEETSQYVKSEMEPIRFEDISNVSKSKINEFTNAYKKEFNKNKISQKIYAALLFNLVENGLVKFDEKLDGKSKSLLGRLFCVFMSIEISKGVDPFQEFRKYSDRNMNAEELRFISHFFSNN